MGAVGGCGDLRCLMQFECREFRSLEMGLRLIDLAIDVQSAAASELGFFQAAFSAC